MEEKDDRNKLLSNKLTKHAKKIYFINSNENIWTYVTYDTIIIITNRIVSSDQKGQALTKTSWADATLTNYRYLSENPIGTYFNRTKTPNQELELHKISVNDKADKETYVPNKMVATSI